MELGRVGIWSGFFRSRDEAAVRAAAAEVEALGFGTLWIPGGAGGAIFDSVANCLGATRRLVVATGIVNLWMHEPAEVASAHRRLNDQSGGRFVLGLGVSHRPLVDTRLPGKYRSPLAAMDDYLDALDGADPPVPSAERVLAALGPKMLERAAARSAGAHPYLVNPAHTAFARGVLGPGPLLAPEQKVLLGTDPVDARARARDALAPYLRLPNYVGNLRRIGYGDADVSGEGSDRLVDDLVVWGERSVIADRVRAHLDAGADHVCLQVVGTGNEAPLKEWRELAGLL